MVTPSKGDVDTNPIEKMSGKPFEHIDYIDVLYTRQLLLRKYKNIKSHVVS